MTNLNNPQTLRPTFDLHRKRITLNETGMVSISRVTIFGEYQEISLTLDELRIITKWAKANSKERGNRWIRNS